MGVFEQPSFVNVGLKLEIYLIGSHSYFPDNLLSLVNEKSSDLISVYLRDNLEEKTYTISQWVRLYDYKT
jgi:hypothetical protein